MSVCAFVACPAYDDRVPEAVGRAFALLKARGELPALAGKRVLVKPNLLTDRLPEQAVTTHPAVLRAVIRFLRAAGAEVTVGDSPASTANIANVWAKSGLAAVCTEEGVPLAAFEQGGGTVVERDGYRFAVAKAVLEADFLLNLPKLKSHTLTLLTASVKNIFGIVPGYAKTQLHRTYPRSAAFGGLLRAIWKVVPPSLTLVDAVVGMEGQGPANGRPIPLGFLAAGRDPFLLDRALCRLLGIEPRRVPYLMQDVEAVPVCVGDSIRVEHFEVPAGQYLLNYVPGWLVKLVGAHIWVRPAFDPSCCKRCGQCVRACPAATLMLEPGAPAPYFRDPQACIGCGCCHEVCPAGAIHMKQCRILKAFNVFKGLD